MFTWARRRSSISTWPTVRISLSRERRFASFKLHADGLQALWAQRHDIFLLGWWCSVEPSCGRCDQGPGAHDQPVMSRKEGRMSGNGRASPACANVNRVTKVIHADGHAYNDTTAL